MHDLTAAHRPAVHDERADEIHVRHRRSRRSEARESERSSDGRRATRPCTHCGVAGPTAPGRHHTPPTEPITTTHKPAAAPADRRLFSTRIARCTNNRPVEKSAGLNTAYRGRSVGKRMTSRMCVWSVRSMTSRSTPMPRPPVGGIPYSRARRKSSSIG